MELLERARELEAIDAAVESVATGTGAALVFEGPAGIGKTGLLRAAGARARAAGLRVLGARAGELEQGFAWGVVRQLFEALVAEARPRQRTGLLAGAAALALPALGFEPGGGDEVSFATLHGLFWLTVNVTRAGPALIVVDDLQWADPPSLRFLSYLSPRLEGVPVLVVAAARDEGPALGLVERPLRPAALSAVASATVVRGELGQDAADELCEACHEMTGGNPFLLHELVRSAREAGLAGNADAPRRVRAMTPEVVSRSVLVRLSHLPAGAAEMARGVAVLGTRADLRRTGELAGLDAEAATAAAEALIAADIVRSDGQRLEFGHPIVRAAVYNDLSAPRRGRWHARAARLLAGEAVRPGEVANHLLAATPEGDRWAVAALRAAAADARAEGAPEPAAAFLRRALAEPPAPEDRADLLAELGQVVAASDPAAAVVHLEEALSLVDDQPRRAGIALALGGALAFAGRFPQASEQLRDALAQLGDRDPDLRVAIESTLLAVARYELATADVRFELLARIRARAAAGEELDPRLHAHLAIETAAAGADLPDAVHHARQALEGLELVSTWAVQHVPEIISVLIFADLAEEARRAVDAAHAIAARRGSPLASALVASAGALMTLWAGAVDEAVAYARESLSHVGEGWLPVITTPFLVDALCERDDVAAARAELAARGLDGELPPGWPSTVVRFMRGRLHAAAGDHRLAVADLTAAGAAAEAWGVRNPATMPWRSSAAVSFAALGERDTASALAAEEVARARQWGAGRAIGVALRAAGLAEPGPEGIELLRDAVAALERAPAPLERARALSDLGARLRRDGRRAEAREVLADALDLAHHCGGIALGRRTREELVLAGAKPRRDALRGRDALTPAELRVAQLAAAGATNRAIAEALFVTLRTVEHHLTSAYAKLAIGSREQLATALNESASPS